ncbi:hypothetical protein L9F63_023710, partial [Diploptera punctata]
VVENFLIISRPMNRYSNFFLYFFTHLGNRVVPLKEVVHSREVTSLSPRKRVAKFTHDGMKCNLSYYDLHKKGAEEKTINKDCSE